MKKMLEKKFSFKNTYATFNDKLLFAKPMNNDKPYELYGIALEKGYASYQALKSDEKTIESGFKGISGGYGYKVYKIFFGAKRELFKCKYV